jgi:hypothetical protein
VAKVDQFLNNEAKGTRILGARSIEELIRLLKKPRRVMLLVQAGKAVDDFIQMLVIDWLPVVVVRYRPNEISPRFLYSKKATLSSMAATRCTRILW